FGYTCAMTNKSNQEQMELIQSVCKNRGFIYPAGELYGGLAGFYDYGPLGSLLKNNIKNAWIDRFVHRRFDTYLLDSAIVMGEAPLTAAGHVGGFSDPLVDDLVTNKRYRADHLLEEAGHNPAGLSVEELSTLIQKEGMKSPDGKPLGEVRQFNLMLKTQLG